LPAKIEELPNDTKYLIFQALSHHTRVKILTLIAGGDLTFASLKRDARIESSGQLQHHLQKLSPLITEKDNGSYGLTDAGRKALDIFRESERSERSLEDLCCLPAPSEMAQCRQVGKTGSLLRLLVGLILMAMTIGIIASYLETHQMPLTFYLNSTSYVSFGVAGAMLFGFFGISFLIAAVTRYPGCEITAIPNLFSRRKRYCSCMITAYNLPNGHLLQSEKR
jgi:hypothetical protein